MLLVLALSAFAGEPTVTVGWSWGYWRQVHLEFVRPSIDAHVAWDVGPFELGAVVRRHLSPAISTWPGFDVGGTARYAKAQGPWVPAIGVEIGLTSSFDLSEEFKAGWPGWDTIIEDRLKLSPLYVALDADPARFRIPLGKSGVALAVDVLGLGLGTTVPALGRVALVRIDLIRLGVAL